MEVFPTQDQLSQHQEYWNKRMGVYTTPPRGRNPRLFRSSSTDLSSATFSGVGSEVRPSTAGGRGNARKGSPAKSGHNNKGNKSGYNPKPTPIASRNKIPNGNAVGAKVVEKKFFGKKNGGFQRKDDAASPPKITILQRPTCPEDAMAGLATITGMSLSQVYEVYEKKGMVPPVEELKQEVVKKVSRDGEVNKGGDVKKVSRDGEGNKGGDVKRVNSDGAVGKVIKEGETKKSIDVNKVSKACTDSKPSPTAGEKVVVLLKKRVDAAKTHKGGEGCGDDEPVKKDREVVKKAVTVIEESLITPVKTRVNKDTEEIGTPEAVPPVLTPLKEEELLAAKNFLLYEKWAGPAFTNSPPPSSLPIPSFSWKRKELQSPDAELTQLDTEAATRGLRRLLNLDF